MAGVLGSTQQMSRAISEEITAFLQAKVREWLAAEASRTSAGLARQAGISAAQVSYLLNRGTHVGWKTATGLGLVFGYQSIGEVETAARRWQAETGRAPASSKQTPTRAPQRRLRDRPEWVEVVAQAQQERPYIPKEVFDRVGRLGDDEIEFADGLAPSFVGDVAHAFFANASRRRPPTT